MHFGDWRAEIWEEWRMCWKKAEPVWSVTWPGYWEKQTFSRKRKKDISDQVKQLVLANKQTRVIKGGCVKWGCTPVGSCFWMWLCPFCPLWCSPCKCWDLEEMHQIHVGSSSQKDKVETADAKCLRLYRGYSKESQVYRLSLSRLQCLVAGMNRNPVCIAVDSLSVVNSLSFWPESLSKCQHDGKDK